MIYFVVQFVIIEDLEDNNSILIESLYMAYLNLLCILSSDLLYNGS